MANRRFLSARVALTVAAVAVLTAVAVVPRAAARRARPSDFDRELARIDVDVAGLMQRARTAPADPALATTLAYRMYQRASVSGRSEDFNAAGGMIAATVARFGPAPDAAVLQASLAFRAHDVAAARGALESIADATDNADAQALLGDLDVQEGRYAAARMQYETAVRQQRTPAALARLAYLTAHLGDREGADRLYADAEDEVTAKDMRAYAWLEVQRGQLQLGQGRYADALAHYRLAERAYSGYWLVAEHMGELMGAMRRFPDAIAQYETAIARAPRPDLLQQLGDLYQFMGRASDATRYHDQALRDYRAAIDRGETQYVHHLAAYYADVAEDGVEAVRWARRDYEARTNYLTQDGLAWALFRSGRTADALSLADAALASGIVDAHLYAHAAAIAFAAGRPAEGGRLDAMVAAINPRFSDFHVHR